VTGCRIPCAIAPRRHGDVAAMWADPGKARRELGWQAERTLEDMCADGWRWQRQNPAGYADIDGQAAAGSLLRRGSRRGRPGRIEPVAPPLPSRIARPA